MANLDKLLTTLNAPLPTEESQLDALQAVIEAIAEMMVLTDAPDTDWIRFTRTVFERCYRAMNVRRADWLERGITAAQNVGDREAEADLRARYGVLLNENVNVEAASKHLNQARTIASEIDNAKLEAQALFNLLSVVNQEANQEILESIRLIVEQTHDPAIEAEYLSSRAARQFSADNQSARADYVRMLALAQENNLTLFEGVARLHLLGLPDESTKRLRSDILAEFDAVEVLFRRAGKWSWVSIVCGMRANCLETYEAKHAELERSLSIARRIGWIHQTIDALIALGKLALQNGQTEAAQTYFSEAQLLIHTNHPQRAIRWLNDIAASYENVDNHAAALPYLETIEAFSVKLNLPDFHDIMAVRLALGYAQTGHLPKAVKLLEESIQRREQLGKPGYPSIAEERKVLDGLRKQLDKEQPILERISKRLSKLFTLLLLL